MTLKKQLLYFAPIRSNRTDQTDKSIEATQLVAREPLPRTLPPRRTFAAMCCDCSVSTLAILGVVQLVVLSLLIGDLSSAIPMYTLSITHALGTAELCLPIDPSDAQTYPYWRPSTPWNGASLSGDDIVRQTRGLYGWLGLPQLFASPARNALDLPDGVEDNTLATLAELLERPTFAKYFDRRGGVWGWFVQAMQTCGSVFGTNDYGILGYDEVVGTKQDRSLLSKQNSIPDFIMRDKVLLTGFPFAQQCTNASDYSGSPTTLLNMGKMAAFPEGTRDLYKRAYMNGFYDAQYGATPSQLANRTSCIVVRAIVDAIRADPEAMARDECFGYKGLPGALCILWPAMMEATMRMHLGDPEHPDLSYNITEMTKLMHSWILNGFDRKLFTTAADKQKQYFKDTQNAAARLLCEFGRLAKVASSKELYAESAQARWLKAAREIDPENHDVQRIFDSDAAATETLHNALALGLQIASAVAHALRNLANTAFATGATASSELLLSNATRRQNFIRETFRFSPPGVPFLFSKRVTGKRVAVPYRGASPEASAPKEVVVEKDGPDTVFLSVAALQEEHPQWAKGRLPRHALDMERERYSQCPFLQRQASYERAPQKGGASTTFDDHVLQPLAQTKPDTSEECVSAHSYENNVFMVNSSFEEDIKTWFTSLSGFRPFGVGYRRCPGEALTWRTMDAIVRAIDQLFVVRLVDPVADGVGTQRFGLASVPINGARVRLELRSTGGSELDACVYSEP